MTREPQERGDQGFSLVELLVVVVLFGIISAVVGTTLVGASQTTRRTEARAAATASLRATLELVSRELRVADPMRSGTASAVQVDVKRPDTATTARCYRVTYAVDAAARTLTVTSQPYAAVSTVPTVAVPVPPAPTCSALDGTATSRVLVRDLDVSQTGFGYRSAVDGSTLASVTAGTQVGRVTVGVTQLLPEGAPLRMSTQAQVRNSKR